MQSNVQHLKIDPAYINQRIDNFLMRELKGVPKSYIYRIIRKGEVRINGKRIDASYKLQAEDTIRIPPVRVAQRTEKTLAKESLLKLIEQNILYEDESLIAINKPCGIPVHGGNEISLGVIDIVRQLYPKLKQVELVHRLDKGTSGCLIIAKKRSALQHLQQQFREHKVEKYYLAFVLGKLKTSQTAQFPLQKNILQSGERMVKVNPNGKPAQTDFTLVKAFPECSLIRAKPLTGRTHQIRVHSLALHHPIGGDDKYGDRTFNHFLKQHHFRRMFLHAEKICFQSPDTLQWLCIEAPIDDAFKQVIKEAPTWQNIMNY